MFDSVLEKRRRAGPRLLAYGLSLAIHAAALGGLVWFAAHRAAPPKLADAVQVVFLAAPESPKPPAPVGIARPSAPPARPAPHRAVRRVRSVAPTPTVAPPSRPKAELAAPPPAVSSSGDAPSGEVDGTRPVALPDVPSDPSSGAVDRAAPRDGAEVPVFLGPGMTPPTLDVDRSGSFHWTRAQLDAHLSGHCLAQCVLSAEGTLSRCKILTRIDQVADAQVLDYLAHLKFTPATQGGHPVSLIFTIPLHLEAE